MTDLNDPGDSKSGIRLTQEVIQALPPLSREDEAVEVIVKGMIKAAELLQEDDVGTTER